MYSVQKYFNVRSQYLGRYEFAGLDSVIGQSEHSEDEKRSADIGKKLGVFLEQKNIEIEAETLSNYLFMSKGGTHIVICDHEITNVLLSAQSLVTRVRARCASTASSAGRGWGAGAGPGAGSAAT